jgi:hypothetical protein
MSAKYVEVEASAVPSRRWHVPARNAGQTVEIAYAHASPDARSEADEGDEWQRVTDRGVGGGVRYYRLRRETS